MSNRPIDPDVALLAKCVGALEALAQASEAWEARLTSVGIEVNEAGQALHRLAARLEAAERAVEAEARCYYGDISPEALDACHDALVAYRERQ
jgi:hypothetical protein